MLLARQVLYDFYVIELSLPFADLLPNVLRARLFFTVFFVRSSSGYSLVHFLPTSSSKSAPSPTVFYDFYVRSSSLYVVSCTFCRPHPKSAPSPAVFYDFYVRSSSGCSSLVHFLPTSSSKRAPSSTFFFTFFL